MLMLFCLPRKNPRGETQQEHGVCEEMVLWSIVKPQKHFDK